MKLSLLGFSVGLALAAACGSGPSDGEGGGGAGGGGLGGSAPGDVSRFDGDYGGNVTLTCPGLDLVTIGLSLSISNGTITVSSPRPGGGIVAANGDASMTVENPSDVSGSSVLAGTFTVSVSGVASGGGQWTEHHATEDCEGDWAVQR